MNEKELGITFKIALLKLLLVYIHSHQGHQCPLPASFGDDHFRPQLIKLIPQRLHLQVRAHVQKFGMQGFLGQLTFLVR